jgi:hypothetical protein
MRNQERDPVYCPLCGAFCGEHFLCESCRAYTKMQADTKIEIRRLEWKAELNLLRALEAEGKDKGELREFHSKVP